MVKGSTVAIGVGLAAAAVVVYFLFFRKGSASGLGGGGGGTSSGGGGGGTSAATSSGIPAVPLNSKYTFGGQTVTGGNPYALPSQITALIGPYTPAQALTAVSQSMAYPQLSNAFEANIENAQAALSQAVYQAGYRYPTPASNANVPLVTLSQQATAIQKAIASGVSPRGI